MGRDFRVFMRHFYKHGELVSTKPISEDEYDREMDSQIEFPMKVSRHNSHIHIWNEGYIGNSAEISDDIKELTDLLTIRTSFQDLLNKDPTKACVEFNSYKDEYWASLSPEEKENEIKITTTSLKNEVEEMYSIREAIAVYYLLANMAPVWVRYD